MIENKIKNEIISLIPSITLKEVIISENHQFSDEDLLKIITDYAENYQQKIDYYKYVRNNSTNKKSIIWANILIKYQENMLDEFKKESQDSIYDISIKCNPNDYEEKFYSYKFDDAITIIKAFLEYYKDCNAVDNINSKYTIVKRKIHVPKKASEIEKNDELGICDLGYKLKIKKVDMYNIQNEIRANCKSENDCDICEERCMDNYIINYPLYLEKYDLVKYIPPWKEYNISDRIASYKLENDKNYIYGVMSFDMNHNDEACILLLDSPYVKNRNIEEKDEFGCYPFYMSHDHVRYELITKVDVNSIDDEFKKDYEYVLAFLKKQEINKKN